MTKISSEKYKNIFNELFDNILSMLNPKKKPPINLDLN